MNKQLKKLFTLGVLFVGISTLLWNCEKETLTLEKENSPTAQNNKDLVGYIVKPDSVFKANKKIKDYITKTFSSKSKNNSKAIVSDIYGFSIDTTKVQIIVASSYQSYTFYVERENSTPDILENYVLNIFNDGGYNQLLISYPVAEINGDRTYNINTATATYINDPNLLAKGVQCANASEEIIAWDPDAGVCVDYNCKAPTGNGQHAPGDACSAIGEDRAHTECSGGWVVTGCINYGGSGSGFGGGGSSGGSSGGVSDGSSGGDTNIDVSDNFDDPNIGVVPFDLITTEVIFDSNLNNTEWIDEIGNYLGRPALKYFQKAIYSNGDLAYNLDAGAVLYVSGSKRMLSGHDDTNSIIATTDENGPFYYLKIENTWYEVSLDSFQPGCLSCDLEVFFTQVSIATLKFTGRYIIPVEDVLIIFNGTDFDGNEANRYLSAGMLLISIVPGGKLLKAVKVIPGAEIAWKKIIKWGGSSATLTYNVVNGVIDFGNRSQLAQLLGTTANIEAHHIIPWIAGGTHDVVQAAARNGFHLNMLENGIGLEKFTTLIGTGLHGNHPAYDRYVIKRLDDFASQVTNFTPEQANNFILNQLIPDLKGLITTARNSGLNLNEYFKQVVNPAIGI